MEEVRQERPRNIGKVYRLLRTSRSAVAYKSKKDDKVFMDQLEKLAKVNPVEGFF